MQHQRIIKTCCESMNRIITQTKQEITSLHEKVPNLKSMVEHLKERVKHCVEFKGDGAKVSIQNLILSPWVRKREGIDVVGPVILQCHAKLQDCIHNRMVSNLVENIQKPLPEPVVKSEPPSPPLRRHRYAKSSVENPILSVSDEEEYIHDETAVPEKKTHSRVISSHSFNKMKVGRDDFIITSKRLQHHHHQIFINITRLQELIRSEGKRVENDPFILYVSKLKDDFFVSKKQFDKVLRASDAMRNLKRTRAHKDTETNPNKVVKTQPPPVVEQVKPPTLQVLHPTPTGWEFHPSSDTKYYNFQSLFPSPETRSVRPVVVTESQSIQTPPTDSLLKECFQKLETRSSANSYLTEHMQAFADSHGSLKKMLQFLNPRDLLPIYHFYSVFAFLTQFFIIRNANDLLNEVPRDHITTESEWFAVIHKNCSQFEEIVQNNTSLKDFEKLFHSFYGSIPTQSNLFYQGDASIVLFVENVSMSVLCDS